MRRDTQPVQEAPVTTGTPEELVEEVGGSDDVRALLSSRLFYGFRADFQMPATRTAAARVILHAIRTFGSEEKAHSWLFSSCGALNKEHPYELLKAGKHKAVDEELDRIDYGVYV